MTNATLVWPVLAVMGFLLFTGVVVALGASTTARYEFERNGAHAVQSVAVHSTDTHPAGRRPPGGPTSDGDAQLQPQPVALAVRVAPAPGDGPGWWLVDESAEVLDGPFPDRIDADWAALSGGLPAVPVFGARLADGSFTPKPSPEERAWLRDLGDQLDRLPEEWDTVLTDTDPLTTLVVEIAAAVVEAGLSLHDPMTGNAGGGVCLAPGPGLHGVLVSWQTHDRLSLQSRRAGAADEAVRRLMNATIAGVLTELGFVVEPFGAAGCSLVTALR